MHYSRSALIILVYLLKLIPFFLPSLLFVIEGSIFYRILPFVLLMRHAQTSKYKPSSCVRVSVCACVFLACIVYTYIYYLRCSKNKKGKKP